MHSHGGHRTRMRARAEKEGLEAFAPHEVLELILFYVLPRRDVNPLAHEMIDRFGSVENVLRASEADLSVISGIGPGAAKKIVQLGRTMDAYRRLDVRDRPSFGGWTKSIRLIRRFFDGMCENQCWLFCLSANGYLLHASKLCGGMLWGRAETVKDALKMIFAYHAYAVIVVQFRPKDKNAQPNQHDIISAKEFSRTLSGINIALLDHIIITDQESTSMRSMGILTGQSERYACALSEQWLKIPDDGGEWEETEETGGTGGTRFS